jgi:hypothetical protein
MFLTRHFGQYEIGGLARNAYRYSKNVTSRFRGFM